MTCTMRLYSRFSLATRSIPILVLTLTSVARAQESIPTELALALLGFGAENRDATLLVGKAPADYSADVYIPAGGRIVGSLVSPRQTTVIVTGTGSTEALRDGIERTLMSRGWTRFQMPSQRGGFVQAMPARYTAFCKGTSSAVSVNSVALDNGVVQARLDFGPGRGRCEPPARDDFAESRNMRFPTLQPPSSSTDAIRECVESQRSGSHSAASTGTLLRTALSPSELLAHYGSQLTAQGWRRVADRESASWTIRDSTGASRTATVSAVRTERPSCYRVDMSLSVERE